jgi:hypothetical protein
LNQFSMPPGNGSRFNDLRLTGSGCMMDVWSGTSHVK